MLADEWIGEKGVVGGGVGIVHRAIAALLGQYAAGIGKPAGSHVRRIAAERVQVEVGAKAPPPARAKRASSAQEQERAPSAVFSFSGYCFAFAFATRSSQCCAVAPASCSCLLHAHASLLVVVVRSLAPCRSLVRLLLVKWAGQSWGWGPS
eukprot:scaffold746_cov112-Isochrysis_galbana.AAC.3